MSLRCFLPCWTRCWSGSRTAPPGRTVACWARSGRAARCSGAGRGAYAASRSENTSRSGSDPNHCDTEADRLPPAASIHQNQTTVRHGLGSRSVRAHISGIRCQFGWSKSKIRFICYCKRESVEEKPCNGATEAEPGIVGFRGSHCATGSLDSVIQREVLDPNMSHESSTVAIFSIIFIPDLLAASKRSRAGTAFRRAVMTVTAGRGRDAAHNTLRLTENSFKTDWHDFYKQKFPYIRADKNVKTVTWMQCKSLWIKVSAKCINVNITLILFYFFGLLFWPNIYIKIYKWFLFSFLFCFSFKTLTNHWIILFWSQ